MVRHLRMYYVLSKLCLLEPLLDSSCMGPREWVKIAEDIEQNYYIYDGFVVIMGTDTMAYAASAMVRQNRHLSDSRNILIC
jgi:hypothetical protein